MINGKRNAEAESIVPKKQKPSFPPARPPRLRQHTTHWKSSIPSRSVPRSYVKVTMPGSKLSSSHNPKFLSSEFLWQSRSQGALQGAQMKAWQVEGSPTWRFWPHTGAIATDHLSLVVNPGGLWGSEKWAGLILNHVPCAACHCPCDSQESQRVCHKQQPPVNSFSNCFLPCFLFILDFHKVTYHRKQQQQKSILN